MMLTGNSWQPKGGTQEEKTPIPRYARRISSGASICPQKTTIPAQSTKQDLGVYFITSNLLHAMRGDEHE
jgi:hypothetical protein